MSHFAHWQTRFREANYSHKCQLIFPHPQQRSRLRCFGREPLLIVPARCEGVSDSSRAALVGVGSLAVTEHGVVFGAGDPPRSLIVARNRISSAAAENTFGAGETTVRKRDAMLVIRWLSANDNESAAAFTVADPGALVAELTPSKADQSGL